MMKSFKIALLLALLLPVFTDVSADTRPSKPSSFKSGFSSGKSAPASSNRSFGSFGSRSGATPARPPDAAPARKSGGFGAFGSSTPRHGDAAPLPQKSDSALSQGLGKGEAQANALRTLEQRRAAEQARTAPVPSGPLPSGPQYGSRTDGQRDDRQPGGLQGPGPIPGPIPVPIIINNGNNGNGLVNMITGFLLAKATSPAVARTNGYPGATAPAGTVASPPANSGGGFFMSLLRTFAWLAIVATVGWLLYFGWKFLRRGSAPTRANYSFERH